MSQRVHESSNLKKKTCPRRGKRRVTKLRLVILLNLIGGEDGASFLDQSQERSNVKPMPSWITFDTELNIALWYYFCRVICHAAVGSSLLADFSNTLYPCRPGCMFCRPSHVLQVFSLLSLATTFPILTTVVLLNFQSFSPTFVLYFLEPDGALLCNVFIDVQL